LFKISAAELLRGARWTRIRGDAMTAAGGACEVCGTARDKGMIGDEVWDYDAGIATLVRVRIVCPDCNGVTHFARTAVQGYGDVAVEHMARVNGTSIGAARRVVAGCIEEWRARSELEWTVVISPGLLARYPELTILTDRADQH
jgi:hypothetical protein